MQIAAALAKEGVAKLAICARRKLMLERVRDQITADYPSVEVVAYQCDISDPTSRDALVQGVLGDFRHLDVSGLAPLRPNKHTHKRFLCRFLLITRQSKNSFISKRTALAASTSR